MPVLSRSIQYDNVLQPGATFVMLVLPRGIHIIFFNPGACVVQCITPGDSLPECPSSSLNQWGRSRGRKRFLGVNRDGVATH